MVYCCGLYIFCRYIHFGSSHLNTTTCLSAVADHTHALWTQCSHFTMATSSHNVQITSNCLFEWQLVHCIPTISILWVLSSNSECARNKSAATVWCSYPNINQNPVLGKLLINKVAKTNYIMTILKLSGSLLFSNSSFKIFSHKIRKSHSLKSY